MNGLLFLRLLWLLQSRGLIFSVVGVMFAEITFAFDKFCCPFYSPPLGGQGTFANLNAVLKSKCPL